MKSKPSRLETNWGSISKTWPRRMMISRVRRRGERLMVTSKPRLAAVAWWLTRRATAFVLFVGIVRSVFSSVGSVLFRLFLEGLHQVDRQGKDDCVALVTGELGQCLHVAQLQCFGFFRQTHGGTQQFFSRFVFALSVDHLGSPLPLRLRLAGDGAHHAFVQVHVL